MATSYRPFQPCRPSRGLHPCNNALAVKVRRAEAADLGSRLADHRLVGAGQNEQGALRLGGDVGVDALGQREHDRVREPEREVKDLALRLDAITGAAQLELTGVALGYALDHGDERTLGPCRRAPSRPGRRGDFDGAVELDRHGVGKRGNSPFGLVTTVLRRRSPTRPWGAGRDVCRRAGLLRRRCGWFGSHHHTSQSSSPPSFKRRASRSLTRP
jgi:hypothetical protein